MPCAKLRLDEGGVHLRSPQPLRGVLGRAGCSPLRQHRGREGGLVPSVPKAGGCGGPLSIPLCVPLRPTATYLTEMENSPGELSLSRIRKAPRCLHLRSRSSARCREILPAYHLRGAPGSAVWAPLGTWEPPQCRIPTPQDGGTESSGWGAGAGSPLGSPQGWDPPAVVSPFPFHPHHLSQHFCRGRDHRVLRMQTRPRPCALTLPCRVRAASPTATTASCHLARHVTCLVPHFAACPPTLPRVPWPPVGTALPGATGAGVCRAENPPCQDETLPACIASSC